MAFLAAVGLFVTFKPLMERASRQKQVVDIQVISPDDVDAIKIQEGHDLVTLPTCHPPNTGGRQRLLVFCERSEE